MIMFKAISNASGNDAIRFTGTAYQEVKDCDFAGFNKVIVSTNSNNLWVFENTFEDCSGAGIEIAAGANSGGTLEMSNNDFTRCAIGVNLLSGLAETISLLSCNYYNTTAGSNIAIQYTPATFSTFTNLKITGNTWNNQGTYISGFDFTRADGRDASAYIEANVGVGDYTPMCKINVVDNASPTTVTTAGKWYKAVWTNTSSIPCKFTVVNNSITYQSLNKRNGIMILSGDVSVNNYFGTVLTICIVKNGVTTTRYGESNLRISSNGQPFQFSSVIYLQNISPNDYFEVYCTSSNSGDQLTFQDMQWYTECK